MPGRATPTYFYTGLKVLFSVCGAILVSIGIPFRAVLVQYNGTEYPDFAIQLLVIGAVVTTLVYFAFWLLKQFTDALVSKIPIRYRTLMPGVISICVFAVAYSMGFEILIWQMLIILFVSLLISVAVIYVPLIPKEKRDNVDIFAELRNLWQYRGLIRTWLRYNLSTRYQESILGVIWIILLPLATSMILAVVFTFLLERQAFGDVPFITFLLCGLINFTLFQQGIVTAATSISSKTGTISQIYFPRETLVIIDFGEKLFDLFVMYIVLLVVNLFFGILPNANYVFLPVLWLIHFPLTLGFMLVIATLGVFIPDVPNFLRMFARLLFYATGIIHPLTIFPPPLFELVHLNPMAGIIEAYRDIFVYNRPPDFHIFYYPLILALTMLYMGYIYLKANESTFADYV